MIDSLLTVTPTGRTTGRLPAWTIQCDFDGTISRQDVTDTLLTRYGLPGWQALEDAWEQGEIGSRECMRKQVALLDMSSAELHASLASIELDPGFVNFANEAQALGIGLQIVSDGLDYAISTILAREGLVLPILANRLLPAGPRRWRLETPWEQPGCASANCKCSHLLEPYDLGQRVLYIGDGSSDFCVSDKAGFVLAKSKLLTHCREKGIAHAAFTDFDEALERLHAIVNLPVEEHAA